MRLTETIGIEPTEGDNIVVRRRDFRERAINTNTGRLVVRKLRLSGRRPQPPTKPSYASGRLTWGPPTPDNVFTHYRIRVDNEASDPIQVPSAQTMLPIATGTKFWVSTYNDSLNLESNAVST